MEKIIDSEIHKEAGAVILRSYGSFLKQQNKNFAEFEKRLNIILLGKPNSKPLYPIGLDTVPYENVNILDIIESDNKILNKILAVFCALCGEIKALEKEATEKHYYFLAFYGEFHREKDCTPEESIGVHMESLHLLTAFVKRSHEVVSNVCHQICALFTCGLISLKGVKLNFIISHVTDMLVMLVTLDYLVGCSPLQSHWAAYRRAVRSLQQSPGKHGHSAEGLKSLDGVLASIEDKVITDKIFQGCLDALSTFKKTLIESKGLAVAEEFSGFLKGCLTEMERLTVDYYESTSVIQWVKVNALFVFNVHVFGSADKKTFKTLCDINVKAHSVPLFGMAVWYPEQFLMRHASTLWPTSNKLSQTLGKARHTYITSKKQNLLRDAHNAQLQSSKWSLNMTQTFGKDDTQMNAVQMNERMQLLLQGVRFASQINFIVTSFTNIHMSQGIPITKSSLMAICKLVEILKGLQFIFKNNFASIAASSHLIVQHLSFQIISQLIASKKSLMADKNYAKQRLDELTAIVIAERSLRGPATSQRRTVASMALSIVPGQVFSEDTFYKITSLLEQAESISQIQLKMERLCNCSFLYWHKTIVPVYFHTIFSSKKDMNRLSMFFVALNDCSKAIKKYERCIPSKDCSSNFYKEIGESFNDHIMKPLGQQVETNLRLHIHCHLQLDSMNPFTVPVMDNNTLMKLDNLRLDDHYLSVSSGVEHYLSYMFYNLTTVVLPDWKTYGEMRQLANFKFNLKTVEDNLPTQTLEQGLDVLEIMRNIHVFVSKYLYNLNNQIFIEQSSNNKHLNTINIRHIANSIRTHGTGIMNTTVNFTYQFLRKKFHTFNQFMYDEQIKSRLIKDMRHFRETGIDTEQMYSYRRAEKFNKGIRNLGLNGDNQSYLDLFRVLISHIGNAMGYVRMIRSGGLHCCANATAFLPSLDEFLSYSDFCDEEKSDDIIKESADNLEATVKNLIANFSQGTDYFKLLVDVFAPVFRNPENVHLKTFFMIIPPLTLNFVEHMLLSKDKMSKKNKFGAAFTDDGFAMGLAYILKLLNQDNSMDSLHWFKSVEKHISQERKAVAEQLAKSSTQLQQALTLTEKKLNVLEQEFQLLYFSFSSARIFFQ